MYSTNNDYIVEIYEESEQYINLNNIIKLFFYISPILLFFYIIQTKKIRKTLLLIIRIIEIYFVLLILYNVYLNTSIKINYNHIYYN